jgi:hypothetical protein
MKADIEYGIQIINFTSCIDILVIKREKSDRAYGGHRTYKSNYYSFMGRGGDWNFSMNRATKAFHNNLESAVEHIMAGRTSYGEYPQLVSNDVKIDAIEKCSRVFNKLKNMDKYKEIIASKQAKVDELWNKTNVISEERRAIEKEIEEFKKSVGI